MSVDPKSTYYDEGGIETIDIIKAKLTSEQYKGYLLGNMIKYSSRANFKGCMERDIDKTLVYGKLLQDLGNTVEVKDSEGDSFTVPAGGFSHLGTGT